MNLCDPLIIQAPKPPKVGGIGGFAEEPCDDDSNLKDLGSQIVAEIRKINGFGGDFD